jgi:hypothetical protein
MVFSVDFQRIFQIFDDFYKYSIQTLPKRIFFGFSVGFSFWLGSWVLSLLLIPIFSTPWGDTVLNDIPGIGLIIALIVAFEYWGLLPKPTIKNSEGSNSS